MNKLVEKYQYLRKNAWCGLWSKRILSELYFLIEASYYNDHVHEELLEKTVDELYSHVIENGAIDKELVLKLEEKLAPMTELAKSYDVHLVGHAHIDMNWKWGFQETVNITIDTFETILQLMDEYPQFKFSQSQASVYKILEDYKPELLQRVKQKIHEGRWEVTASTWVENDKNMSGSESHARHILQTKSYLSKLLEIPAESLDIDFEPDTFGHPETMPELFAQGGIKYYYHCRGNDQMHIHRWQAPSGAEVLVYREPIWYNDQRGDYDGLGFVPRFCHLYGLKTAMKVYGVGDHGGGPTRQELNHFIEMQSWPLMPVIKFSTMRPFFQYLDTLRETFPLIKRELNFIYTGCYTTEARIKRGNKLCEDRIYEAELLDAATKAELDSYTTPSDFGKAWESILFNQFHDILPGSGNQDTVDAAMAQYQQALTVTQVNMKDAMTKLCREMDTSCFGSDGERLPDADDEKSFGAGNGYGNGDGAGYIVSQVDRSNSHRRVYTIFNPTPYRRCEPAEIPLWDWSGDPKMLYATDTNGREFACQFVTERIYYAHKFTSILMDVDVPPMGYATYVLDERTPDCLDPKWTYFRTCGNVPNPPVIDRITDEPIVLENEYVKAQFSPATLQMLSFTDKRSGKELISKPSCSFRMITENPIHGMTSWRIGHYMKVEELNTTIPVKLLSVTKGAVRQSIYYEILFGRSRMHVTAYLDVHSVMVKFVLRISWRELGSDADGIPQLNFTVPFDYAASSYLCAIPMGMQQRAPLAQDVPCLGFMAGCSEEDDASVFVMSDCKYGFRGHDDSISLALLRSSFGPDPSPDQCEHTVILGVGVTKKEEAVQLHEVFAHPLSVCSNQIHEGTIPAEKSWMQMTADARIQAVKPAQNGEGIIVRMHNLKNEQQAVSLSLFREIAKAEITDICENPLQTLSVDGKSCTVPMEPCALTTVRLVLK